MAGTVLAILGSVLHASAIERYDVATMTCPQLQAAMAMAGKAVLRTPSSRIPGLMLYDVYVSRPEACTGQYWPRRTRKTTADGKRCTIYQCRRVTNSSTHR